MRIVIILFSLVIIFLVGLGCERVNALEIKSSAFENNEMIPKLYTCDGKDISPPLNWNDIPEKTKSLALICDDPDAPAGTWVHWVVFNIKSTLNELPAKVLHQEIMLNGARQGINDFGKIGYGGPCPPRGTHRYFFKLYALDSMLDLEPGATKKQLLQAMEGHVLSEAQLVGKYSR